MNRRLCLSAVLFLFVVSLAAPLLAAPAAAPQVNAVAAAAATVNVNSASVAELETLPGIGKKTAEAIVAYRTEKGKFRSTQDLLKVKGIGPKSFEKFRNLVSID